MRSKIRILKKLWAINDFQDSDLAWFADRQLVGDTRRGLMSMSLLLLILVLLALFVFREENVQTGFNQNYFWVMVMAVHINLSARVIGDIKTLHLLGMTLLIISATAYVMIAHQEGAFSPLLLANIALLFMTVPMIPWGLREATCVVMCIYLLLTLSTSSVTGRFDVDTIWALQFFMLAAGMTSLVLVLRGSLIRKNEIISHYELKKAHADLFKLSNQDPLTGAWNRRYMKVARDKLIDRFRHFDRFNFIIFDLDSFKELNDNFGHEFGDQVLILTSTVIHEKVGDFGYLIRIGGDEFVLLLIHDDPEQVLRDIVAEICDKVRRENNQAFFDMSWGCVSVPLRHNENMEHYYRLADQALYQQKMQKRNQDASRQKQTGIESSGVTP